MEVRTVFLRNGGMLPLITTAVQGIAFVAPLIAAVFASGLLAKIAFLTISSAIGGVTLLTSTRNRELRLPLAEERARLDVDPLADSAPPHRRWGRERSRRESVGAAETRKQAPSLWPRC
jgi:hypothetical protein